MRGKDPDRYIENLEEIIISKDKLIDKLRRSAAFTDVTLSILPHISLLNHWIMCAAKELIDNNKDGNHSSPRSNVSQNNDYQELTARNPLLENFPFQGHPDWSP